MFWRQCSILILLLVSPATGAKPEASSRNAKSDPIVRAYILSGEGNLPGAEAVLEAELADAERSGQQNLRLAAVLNNLAQVSGALGRYDRSETLYKRCIHVWRRLGMGQTPHCARSIGGLIALYVNTSQFKKAKSVYATELAPFETIAELPDDERGRIFQLAGVLAYMTRQFDIAETQYLRAATLMENSNKPASAGLAGVLNLLAVLHFRTGRYETSLALLTRAQSAVEHEFGFNSPLLVYTLVNYGSFVRDDRKSEDAFVEALRIAESTLGREHPDTAAVLESYAERLRKLGRKAAARAMEARAKAILENHPEFIRRRHLVDVTELAHDD